MNSAPERKGLFADPGRVVAVEWDGYAWRDRETGQEWASTTCGECTQSQDVTKCWRCVDRHSHAHAIYTTSLAATLPDQRPPRA